MCPPTVELCTMEDDDKPIVYRANKIQRWLWECWLDFCKSIPKGSIGVFNGDAVDGVNLKNGAVVSYERADQINIATEVLSKFAERCSVVYTVFGTEWHEYTSGKDLVQVVYNLRERGYNVKLPRQEVWLELYGQLIHIAHHRATTSAPSSKGTPLARSLVEMLFEAPKRNGVYPNVVIRAHAHDPGYLWTEHGLSIGQPSWQYKTFFAWKKVPAAVPSIGGMLLDWDGEQWRVRPKLYRASGPRIIRLRPSKKS